MNTEQVLQMALVALEANQPINYCENGSGERSAMLREDPFRHERNEKAIEAIKAFLNTEETV